MDQKKPNALLRIDVDIHFRGVIYRIQLMDTLKWIIPLVVIGFRIVRAIHS